jgi:hypothetical protein
LQFQLHTLKQHLQGGGVAHWRGALMALAGAAAA